MQTAPERRSPQHVRVPLDDVLVELFPEGFDEGFEADAVDLGNGGLAMRAPLLPDIGSTLRCSFRSPTDGEPVDADCEVVWAKDSGPSEGHFGLRFTQVPQDSAHAIGRIVDQWIDVLGDQLESEPNLASLALEGVRSPFVGEVAHRAHGALLVEQELPFLRIGTAVQEDGQRQGRLASVDVRMDDDTPRLVLTVVYEDSSPGVEEAASEAEAPAMHADAMDQAAPVDQSWAPVSDESCQVVAESGVPTDADRTFRQDGPPEMDPVSEAWGDVPESPQASAASLADMDDDELARSMTPARDLATLWRRVSPKLEAGRSAGREAWTKLRTKSGPLWTALAARITALASDLRGKHWPAFAQSVRRFGLRLRAFVGALHARRSGGLSTTPTTKRRTTRAPARPQTGSRRQVQASPAEAMPDQRRAKNRRRLALLGVLALVAGAATWVFSGDEEASASAPELSALPAAVVPAPAPVVQAAPAVRSPYEVEANDAVDPESGAQLEAPAAPVLEAGRMDSPTFPRIGAAPTERAASSTSFGAEDVPRARNFTMRMSRRVEGLRGEALPDGFRVDVDGSLSLDRAGPIASAHPSVERATILNRGDHAELRVRFVSGRHPAYRVRANGSSIIVSIGR